MLLFPVFFFTFGDEKISGETHEMFFYHLLCFFISVVYLDLFSISNDLADLSLQVECTHYVGNGGDISDSHVPYFTCPVCKENGV